MTLGTSNVSFKIFFNISDCTVVKPIPGPIAIELIFCGMLHLVTSLGFISGSISASGKAPCIKLTELPGTCNVTSPQPVLSAALPASRIHPALPNVPPTIRQLPALYL